MNMLTSKQATTETTEEVEVLSNSVLQELGADELLALDIASMADLEGFKVYPSGLYRFEIKEAGVEEIGKENKPAIIVGMAVTECIELLDPEEADAVGELPGEHREIYGLSTKNGSGIRAFATMFRQVALECGVKSSGEIMEVIPGYTFTAFMEISTFQKTDADGKAIGDVMENNRIKLDTVEWA